MLVAQVPLSWLRWSSVVLLGVGAVVLILQFAHAHAVWVMRRRDQYLGKLGQQLTFLRLRIDARHVLHLQVALLMGSLGLVIAEAHLLASLLFTLALSPLPAFHHRALKRTTRIEGQLDGWLYTLASSLRAMPALGEALSASALLVQPPLRDELETVAKEHKLGVSLDEALARMAARVHSGAVQSALAALRLGLRTGGNLSDILERSAESLREMVRLEGVVRAKTAEGKAQMFMIAVLPFPLVALVHTVDPTFFRPLLGCTQGTMIIATAALLWVMAVLLARRLVRVDL